MLTDNNINVIRRPTRPSFNEPEHLDLIIDDDEQPVRFKFALNEYFR